MKANEFTLVCFTYILFSLIFLSDFQIPLDIEEYEKVEFIYRLQKLNLPFNLDLIKSYGHLGFGQLLAHLFFKIFPFSFIGIKIYSALIELFCVTSLYLLVRNIFSLRERLLCIAIFLTCPAYIYFHTKFDFDFLNSGLIFLSLYFYTKNSLKLRIVSSILMILAIFTKLSAISLPLALLVLNYRKSFTESLWLIIICILAFALGFWPEYFGFFPHTTAQFWHEMISREIPLFPYLKQKLYQLFRYFLTILTKPTVGLAIFSLCFWNKNIKTNFHFKALVSISIMQLLFFALINDNILHRDIIVPFATLSISFVIIMNGLFEQSKSNIIFSLLLLISLVGAQKKNLKNNYSAQIIALKEGIQKIGEENIVLHKEQKHFAQAFSGFSQEPLKVTDVWENVSHVIYCKRFGLPYHLAAKLTKEPREIQIIDTEFQALDKYSNRDSEDCFIAEQKEI